MSRKTPQNSQKRLPKRNPWAFQKALKTRSKKQENHTMFFIDFLPFWDPPRPPFWIHLGFKITQNSTQGATWDPKPPQVTPKSPQDPPKAGFGLHFAWFFDYLHRFVDPILTSFPTDVVETSLNCAVAQKQITLNLEACRDMSGKTFRSHPQHQLMRGGRCAPCAFWTGRKCGGSSIPAVAGKTSAEVSS